MDKQRILITVKTYPTLSRKYGETVCTAGVREDGSWVRMYPVPFRRLDEEQQYAKFDWVECRLVRNKSDPRPRDLPNDYSGFHGWMSWTLGGAVIRRHTQSRLSAAPKQCRILHPNKNQICDRDFSGVKRSRLNRLSSSIAARSWTPRRTCSG